MKICCIEYNFDAFNGGAATFTRETVKLFNKYSDTFDVDIVQYDPIEKKCEVLEVKHIDDVDIESYDIVMHGCVNCVNRENDEILDLLVSLKNPRTVFFEHDRYPVQRVFWHQKKKARTAMACDYIITCHPFMYKEFVEDKSRILEYNTWLNYRDVTDVTEVKPFNEREIDVLYQARIAPKKGSDGYLEFATTTKELGLYENYMMYGFTGMPAEISCKKHPSVFTRIHKDPNKLVYNTPKSFIELNKFVTTNEGVLDNFNNAKITWAAYKLGKQSKDVNVKMHKGWEGAQLEALAAGTILICNGLQRDLEICGKRLEEYGCFFFIDDNQMEPLIEEVKNANLEEMYQKLMEFRKILFNDKNFVQGWADVLIPIYKGEKKETFIIEASTFKEYKENNSTRTN